MPREVEEEKSRASNGGIPKEKRKHLSVAISTTKKAKVYLAQHLTYLENNVDLETWTPSHQLLSNSCYLLQILEKETPLPVIEYTPSFEPKKEVPPLAVEDDLPGTLEDRSLTLVVVEVLGNLEPEEEIA